MASPKENWKYWYHFIVGYYIDFFFFFFTSTLVAVKISFISFNCLVGFGFEVCVCGREEGVILNCRTQRAVCVT